MKKTIRAFLALCAVGYAVTASAAFPDRPLRLLVGFAPGGSVDGIARLMAQEMSKNLGQSVVVENKPGASTAIAATSLANASPDGYTLMLMSSTNTIAPALSRAPTYNLLKDFTPISTVANGPIVIAVESDSKIRTFDDLVESAKSQSPNTLTYGAGGSATSMHLASLLMQKELGIEMLHVPFKGGSETLNSLLAKQIDMQFATPNSLGSNLGSRVRAIAVTSARRFSELPEVPTLAELGLADFDVSVWYFLSTPAGTPTDVVDRLNAAVRAALEIPELKEKLAHGGVDAIASSPEQARQLISKEVPRWEEVIRSAGLSNAN